MNLSWIKKVYLYLASLASLGILIIGSIILINLGLRTWVFTKADDNNYYAAKLICTEVKNPDGSVVPRDPNCDNPNYEQEQRQEEKNRRAASRQADAAMALSMIIVAAPVFYYHWKLARKEA